MSVKKHLAPGCHTLAIATLIVGSQFLIAAPSLAADGCSACIFENEPTLTEWRRCVEICDKYECYPGHYAACNGSPDGRTECQLDTDSSSGDYMGSSFSDAPSACDSIDCSEATYPERGADFDTANCPGQYEWILYACEDPEPYTNSVGFSCENGSSGSGSPITNRRDFCNEQCPSLYTCKDGFVGEATVETPCNSFHPTSGSECVVSDSGSARVSAIFEPTPDVCECPPDDERSCTGGNPDCESFGRQECVRVLNDYESRWSSCGGEDECDEDGECDEETDQDCCEEQVGAPVNLRTGEVTLSLDLNFEVRVGTETLGLNPRYSSQQAMREYERDALATERGPVQFFGAGWTHRFDHRIQDLPGTNNAVYYGPSGKALTFDNRVQLEKGIGRGSKGGYMLTENDAGFTLVGRSGETLMFERAQESSVDIGRLSSIVDESGSTLSFTYWSTDGSAPCQTTTGSAEEGRLCLVSLNDKAALHFAVYTEVACTASDCDEQSAPRLASATVGLSTDPGDHKKRLVIDYGSAEARLAKDGTSCVDRGESCQGELSALPSSFRIEALESTWTEVASRAMTYTDKSYYRPDLSDVFEEQQTIFARPRDATGTFYPERSVWLLTQVLDEIGALVEGHQYDRWGRGVTSEVGGEFLRIHFSDGVARVFNESDGSFLIASIDRTSSMHQMSLGGDVGCFEKTGQIDYVVGTHLVDKKTSQDGIITKYFYDDRNRVEYIVEGRESDFESCLSEETPPDLATLTDFGGHPFAVCSGSSTSETRFSVQKLEYGDTHRPTRIIRAYSALRMGQLLPGGAPNTSSTRRNPETSLLYDEGGIRVLRRTRKGYTRRRDTSGTERNTYDFQRLQNYSYTDAGDLELVSHQAFDGIKPDVKFTYHDGGTGSDSGQLFQVLVKSQLTGEPNQVILTYRDYDSFGNATRLVDENGVTTLRRFDGNNRLIEMVQDATGPAPRTMAFEYLDNGWQCRATQIGVGNGTHVSTFYGATTGYSGASSACSYTADPICRTQDETAEGELPDASEVANRQEDCLEALGALGQPSMVASGAYDGTAFADFALTSLSYDPASRLVSRISQSVIPDAGAAPGTPGFITSDERKVAFSHADALSLAVEKFTSNALDPVGAATQLRDANSKRRMGSSEEFPTAAGRLRLDYEYDERGDLRAVRAVNADDGSIQLFTTYDYDPAGNLYRMVRGDKEYFYFHDDFGNLVRVKSPDSGVTRYHYSTAGYLERMVVDDAGIDVRYQSDVRGRRVRECYTGDCAVPSPKDRTYTYDGAPELPVTETCGGESVTLEGNHALSRLAKVTHEVGATFYSYNAFGEIKAVHEQLGPTFDACQIRTTRYRYDGNGRVTQIDYPSGTVVRYDYSNPAAPYPGKVEVKQPGDAAFSTLMDAITWSVDGQIASYDAGTVSFDASYDLSGQAVTRTYQGAVGHRFDWQIETRDPAGNIELVSDAATEKSYDYTYDIQSRIATSDGEVVRGYSDCDWIYDAAGNRTSETCFATEVSYTYPGGAGTNTLGTVAWERDDLTCADPPDRITETLSLDVDLAGRRQRAYTKKFPALATDYVSLGYDSGGRLSLIDGGNWEYQYDHTEQRRTKLGVTSAEDTYFFYNPSGQLLTEDRADLGLDYIYLAGHLVAVLTQRGGSTNRAYIAGTDHLGAPLRLFNTTNGEIDWLADAEPFGAYWTHVPSSASDPSLEFNVRGSNQYFDAETGLHANWYRYYDPNTGRYITEDPLLREIPGFEQPSAAFVMNNPGSYTDPDGRRGAPRPAGGAGGVAAWILWAFGDVLGLDDFTIQQMLDQLGVPCTDPDFCVDGKSKDSCEEGNGDDDDDDDERFEKCQDQADSDWAFCNTRVIKEHKRICRASSKERFAFCMRTGVTGQPPLVWR